jgi:hypothetical protein
LLREIVELTSGCGKRVFDRYLNMLMCVSFVVRRVVIDYDAFVRWHCKRDMDIEAAAVTVFVARCDHSDAASNDVAIVLFQPLYFAFDGNAHSLRRIGSFKSHLQRDLHDDLSVAANLDDNPPESSDRQERKSQRAYDNAGRVEKVATIVYAAS